MFRSIPLLGFFLFSLISHAQIVNINTTSEEEIVCEETSEIIPTCLLRRAISTTPEQLITNDLKVCNCIKGSNHIFLDYVKSPTRTEQLKSEKERLLENASVRAANDSLIQATSFSKDETSLEISLLTYGGQEARKLTKDLSPQEGVHVPPPEILKALTEINEISEENNSWQCVTYQEYSVQRQIPAENEFFQLLKNTTSFVPAEWNFTALRQRFDAAPDEEKEIIRLKLTFLTRNPIFKAIFSSVPSERFNASLITRKQNELFSIIQGLKPSSSSSCLSLPNGCWAELHRNGAFNRYNDAVSGYITSNEVIDLSSAYNAQEYRAELQRIMSQGEVLIDSIPTDPEGYFRYIQTANTEIASSCSGSTADPSCYTKFQQHCSYITAIDQRVRSGLKRSSRDISNMLTEDASLHASMNPERNPLFRNFNDNICLQPLSNTAGEALTYFQYKDKHCQGATPLPECSDRQQLLGRYLREHNSGGNDAERNLREGFANVVSDANFIEVSEVQIAAANNISETPSELRARFGNRFPSISPTGSLVSAINRSVASSSSSQLNSSDNSSSDTSNSGSTGTTSVSSNYSGGSASARSDIVTPYKGYSGKETTSVNVSTESSKIESVKPSSTGGSVLSEALLESSEVTSFTSPSIIQGSSDSVRTNKVDQTKREVAPLVKTGGGGVVRRPETTSTSDLGGKSISQTGGGGGAALGKSGKSSGTRGLFFKYNLDREGNEIKPEFAIVPVKPSEALQVEVPRNQLERIRNNPNALILDRSDMNEIFASPDKEVKLILKSENGEDLIVYAIKDSSGGVSFSLNPSLNGRSPASTNGIVRVEVDAELYENIVSNPDIFLNQKSELIQNIQKQDGESILQLVSPGKRARSYKVEELYENVYQFREIRN